MPGHILYPRSSLEPVLSLQEFLTEVIGKGSYGTVFKAVHLTTSKVFAIKEIRKKGNQSTIHHELTTMYKLNHEHVVRLYDHFEDENSVYLVMEFIEGRQLHQSVIAQKRILNNKQIALIIQQLCLAVNYLHELDIVHRDIKPQNIMLTLKNNVKLTDFGASFEVNDARKTTIGTPQYTAPEIVKGRKHTKAVDVWSIGVVLFELTTMKLPFDAKTTLGVYENIKYGKYEFPECITQEEELKDLIRNILVSKPEKRYTANDILQHPWIKNNINSETPRQILISCAIKKQTSMSSLQYLKQKIFKLQFEISKAKIPDKNKQKKLRSELEMKIAVMQGKVKTVNSLAETKEKRIQILQNQIEESKKNQMEIVEIKQEHEKIRELIEDGNKAYLKHVQKRRRVQSDNTTAQDQLTEFKLAKARRPISNISIPSIPPLPRRKNTHSDALTTQSSISTKSIDLTQSCSSLTGRTGNLSSQGIDGFFLWLSERKRTGLYLDPKHSQ